jgi:hypothetical protein
MLTAMGEGRFSNFAPRTSQNTSTPTLANTGV